MAGFSSADEYREMLVRLRAARKAARLTQVQVAQAFGRTQAAISKMESGEIRIDPIELMRFAELYGVEVVSLLPGAEGPRKKGG